MLRSICLALGLTLLTGGASFAAHPLITDDTGTQGRGNTQIELNGEYDYDKEGGVTEKITGIAALISFGLTDTMDVVLGLPYQHIRTTIDASSLEPAAKTTEDGVSDVSVELKWRFFETERVSFALKPVVTLPTGDEDRGLGAGRITCSAFFITTFELEPLVFHGNLGYIRNENKVDERKNLWHASLAAEAEVIENLMLVANIGVEHNRDKGSTERPAFILGGIIYSLSETIAIDFGVKGGLNKAETDYAILAGVTLKLY